MTNASPFLGIIETPDGRYYDIASGTFITPDQNRTRMTPFYGQFLDKDGLKHNLMDFIHPSEPEESICTYDQIIRTQEAFNTLISSPNWLGAHSVAFIGDGGTFKFTKTGSGIVIPPTVFQIDGFNNAIVEITAMTGGGVFSYASKPIGRAYQINNMTAIFQSSSATQCNSFIRCINLTNCTGIGSSSAAHCNNFSTCDNLMNCVSTGTRTAGTGYGVGFYNCTNLTNCTGTGIATNGNGFDTCTNLINCTGEGRGNSVEALTFTKCTNLINCTGTAIGTAGNTVARTFSSCTGLVNCIGTGTGTGTGYGQGFYNCVQLTNCTGTGLALGTGLGISFSSCSYINGCKEGTVLSKTSIWAGTTTFKDEDSNQPERVQEG